MPSHSLFRRFTARLLAMALIASALALILVLPLSADPEGHGDGAPRTSLAYLPLIGGEPPPEGISGRVHHALSTEPITVVVEATLGRFWTTDIATTTTDAKGFYHFTDLSATRSVAIYYSIRVDRPASDTGSPPGHALACRSYPMYDYKPGDRVLIPEFDTSAVELYAPAHNITTTLPVTFTWLTPSFTMPMTYTLRLHEPALDMGPLQYAFEWDMGTDETLTLAEANVPDAYQFGYETVWSVTSHFVDDAYFRSPDTVYCKHAPTRSLKILAPP